MNMNVLTSEFSQPDARVVIQFDIFSYPKSTVKCYFTPCTTAKSCDFEVELTMVKMIICFLYSSLFMILKPLFLVETFSVSHKITLTRRHW